MKPKPPYKEVAEIPFAVMPGRYFHTMFYLAVPPSEDHILGGNVNGLVWRLDDEPESWRVVYRFRWYKSKLISSEDSGDDFSWRRLHVWNVAPEKIVTDLQEVLLKWREKVYGDLKPTTEPDGWETLEIKGGSEKFYEVAGSGKVRWLHIRKIAEIPLPT